MLGLWVAVPYACDYQPLLLLLLLFPALLVLRLGLFASIGGLHPKDNDAPKSSQTGTGGTPEPVDVVHNLTAQTPGPEGGLNWLTLVGYRPPKPGQEVGRVVPSSRPVRAVSTQKPGPCQSWPLVGRMGSM